MGQGWRNDRRGQESPGRRGMDRKSQHAGGERIVADLRDDHRLEGFSGRIGRSLRLRPARDGRSQVRTGECPHGQDEECWESFQEALAYAREAQHREEYLQAAAERHSSPLQVATADFLHAPEIHRIDLADYHGRPGDPIRIFASDDITVTRVGVLITDSGNHLIEMGMARRGGREEWVYTASRRAPGEHVRVIVDAADLPGHLTERRAEKSV